MTKECPRAKTGCPGFATGHWSLVILSTLWFRNSSFVPPESHLKRRMETPLTPHHKTPPPEVALERRALGAGRKAEPALLAGSPNYRATIRPSDRFESSSA